ncbi:hypothetical protein ACN6LM_006547 [Streptomyces sp. SAS_281]|uniref:hypothetical protein n=1 Tax=Streptomyces sp. SAS_281 TaxID=3412744 RepID=UPI00403D2CD7
MAIASVSARAECFSDDPDMHDDHLRHMDLPARAERTAEPTERALTMAVYADGSTDRFENGA